MERALLRAEGLGLRTRRGWVFRDLDLVVHPGELVTLTGPAGGGRTSALLALGGRFRTTHGALTRGRTALGLVPGVNEPEPALTVAEHVGERLRLIGQVRPWHRRSRHALLAAESDALVRDLSPLDRHRLMIKLALLEDPDVLLVDDIDVGLTPTETQTLLSELDATGRAVVAVCRDAAAVAGAPVPRCTPAGTTAPLAVPHGTGAPHGTLTSPSAPGGKGRAPATSRSDVKVPFLSSVGVGR
ncbi:ATP-binding cassette domain-containing protein [Catellatospora vulcania]|uniref:ATP-binding cassette domain-containing protein n=1 Tax=Catellatospora vulcania TaxID=1460450 RepID=UPI0018AFA0EC|nr:ATP-binding cassette domain-containing protein [Catellatospora vulcania]